MSPNQYNERNLLYVSPPIARTGFFFILKATTTLFSKPFHNAAKNHHLMKTLQTS